MYLQTLNIQEASKSKKKFVKTLLKKGCTIGANATIICGVIIKENSFIGAGSVVTKNVDKNCLVFGNPAKKLKIRFLKLDQKVL